MLSQEYKHLFPDLEPALLELMFSKGSIRKAAPGDVLMAVGQPIRNTMIVLDGLVKLYREDDQGDEFFMYHLEPGSACALSIVCGMNRKTMAITAKALTNTTLLIIPLDYVDDWMRQYRTWYYYVMGTFRSRFEELMETIDSIAFKNMDERLEFYLKRHRDTLKTNVLDITHSEIARELNSSREVITRLLRKLSDQGKISLHRSSIEIIKL
jgi:CRP/FNR family transcriptional regulator